MTNTIGSLDLFPPSGGGSGGITHIQGTNGVNVPPNLSGTIFLTFANSMGFINGNATTNTLTFGLNITGASTGVVIFNASGPQFLTSVNGTTGQVLVSEGPGNSPVFQSITGTSPITVTSTGGSIVIGISGGLASSFVEDTGTAIPSGGVLNIRGGTGITTSGTNSTVTITLSGAGSFSTNGVIYFNGSSLVTATGTAGQILTINNSGTPQFATFTFTENSGSASFSASDNLNILGSGLISTLGSGSTVTIILSGAGSFSTNGVIYFNGSSLASTSSGSAGQILVSEGPGAAPSYQTIIGSGSISVASTGGTITISSTSAAASSFVEDVGTAIPSGGVLNIRGGTGITTSGTNSTVTITLSGAGSFSTNGIIYFNGSSLASTSSGSAGQILVSEGPGAAPSYQTITGSGSISVTSTGGTITISSTSAAASSFVEDVGTATPAGGVLNVLGGTGITTSGTNSTVTITLSGAGSFSTNGVIYFNGSSLVTATGTAGQILTINNSGTPQFATFTFTENSGSAVFSSNNLNIVGAGGISTNGTSSTVTISLSGSGSFSSDGVIYWNGTAFASTSAGAAGQVLVSRGGIGSPSAPSFQSITGGGGIDITSNGGTISIVGDAIIAEFFKGNTGTAQASSPAHTINIVGGDGIMTTFATGNTVYVNLTGIVPVVHGGTGDASLATGGVLYGNGTNPVNTLVLNGGQLIQGSNSSIPQAALLMAGTGISISNDSSTNPGQITIFATGATVGFSWQIIGMNQQLNTNTGYICTGGSTLTLTLPTAAGNIGDIIEVTSTSVTQWIISPSVTSQTIQMGTRVTSPTGSLTSGKGNSVRIVCTNGAMNMQQWIVLSAIGTISVS